MMRTFGLSIKTTVRARNTVVVRGGSRSPVELDDALACARERGVVFEFGEAVNDSTEVFDAAEEVFEAYVLVGAVGVGAVVADAEGDDGRGRDWHAPDRADRPARRVNRVDDGRLAVDFFGALDCRARDHRGGRRLRVGGRAEFDDLDVLEAARVEVLSEEFDDESGREVWDESEVESGGGRAGEDGLRARLRVAGAYAADGAGRAEDEFLRELAARHPVHPAADAELTAQARLVQLHSLQHAPVFGRERRDVRREAVNRDDAFGRDHGRQRLHETPAGGRNYPAPLPGQVCARAVS